MVRAKKKRRSEKTSDVALRPTKLRYNNEPIKVLWTSPGKDTWGDFTRGLRRIRVQPKNLTPELSLEILVHEIFHCIISEDLPLRKKFAGKKGDELEEFVVDALGRDFVAILLRNPRMLKWINEVARVARSADLE